MNIEIVSVVLQCPACGHLQVMRFPETNMDIYPSLCVGSQRLGNAHVPTVQAVVAIREP